MHIHKWSKWSEIYLTPMFNFKPAFRYQAETQKRICSRCGLVMEQTV